MGRRGWVLVGIGLLIVVVCLVLVVVAPRVGNAITGADGIHDAAALPRQIQVCGRSWQKDDLDRRFTAAETRETFGGGVVVDPRPFGACPPGPCTDVAQSEACDVVVWVRVGEDAYLNYSLQGGP